METLILPPGLALGIIAFLLALLPAGLFMWLWYLRHHDRPIPAKTISLAFGAGLLLVLPAFWVEDFASGLWESFSPSTSHYFAGAVLPLVNLQDVFLPAIATFFVVATVEEGLRFLVLRLWIRTSKEIDQVFDGLLLGVATGLGFATLENAIYFLNLFQAGSYDTLVFVFFLRFMISTLAHISFGGLMGIFIARGEFHLFQPRGYYSMAFFIPWLLHGLFDLLLGINQSLYAVLMLVPALSVLIVWSRRGDFMSLQRKDGHFLVQEQVPETKQQQVTQQLMEPFQSPWNTQAPWMAETRFRRALLRKKLA